MRPNKLIMSAFGPYAGKVEVELDKLGQNGLYLITGDTGAGKMPSETVLLDYILKEIHYEKANQILAKRRDLSIQYLKDNL